MDAYIERLEAHISALEKSYDNVIMVLNEDVDKDKDGKVKLRDSQIKVYAEGVAKSSETANSLLIMIKDKYDELDRLKNPDKHKDEDKKSDEDKKDDSDKVEKTIPDDHKSSNLSKYLE